MNIFPERIKLERIGIITAALLLLTTLATGCGKIASKPATSTSASVTTTMSLSLTTSATTPTSIAPATTSTSLPATDAVKNSIVQVWIGADSGGTKTFEALGVPVGDGTTVLTVIDYEDFTPGEAEVRTQDNKTYSTTIQAIDARTGATLLKLDSGSLPPVATERPGNFNSKRTTDCLGSK